MSRLNNLILALEEELSINCPRHVMSKKTIQNMLDILRESSNELALVKSKSLQIVPVGEPIEHKANPECYCLFGGHVVDDSFFSVSTNEFMVGINRDTVVQPVRLQPWGEE